MRTAARELQVHTVCQMILAAIAAGAALFWLRSVLLPFILALFFVTGVSPVLYAIERNLRAPRMVAVAIAFMLGIVLFMGLWLMVWLSVASLLNHADTYRERIVQLVSVAEAWVPSGIRNNLLTPPRGADGSGDAARQSPHSAAAPKVGMTEPDVAEPGALEPGASEPDVGVPLPAVSTPMPGAVSNGVTPPAYNFSVFLTQHVGNIMTHLSSALMDLLSSAMMVLIFMFFLLLGDSSTAVRQNGVWTEIESGIRHYIVTKTVISLVTGALFGVVLWAFGIPLALVFGLLAFLLNYIPNIGPIIASLLPLPLILLHPDLSFFSMVVVIALSSSVQFISGNVLEPKIMGDSFRLHPVVILLTLMFWGMLWGIVGMFLATPITAALKIFLEQFDHTRPIARWLEGRFDMGSRSPDDEKQPPSVSTVS